MKLSKIISMTVMVLFLSCMSYSSKRQEEVKEVVVKTQQDLRLESWRLQNEHGLKILREASEKIKERREISEIIDIAGSLRTVRISPQEQYLFDKNKVPVQYQFYVIKLARYYRIDSHVFISLVQIESGWGKAEGYNSIEGRGYGPGKQWADIGLGQLNSRYHDEFERKNYDPELILEFGYMVTDFDATNGIVNLQVTASIINERYNIFGNYDEALMAYNAGVYAVSNNFPGFDHRGKSGVENYAYSILNNKRYITQKI